MIEKHGACMAIALTAMILACGLAVAVVSDDTDAADSTIELRVGDTFSYTPKTNLTSTITATGTAMSGSDSGWLSWDADTGVLSGSPTTDGSTSVTLTAVWTSGDLQQTATQTIDFTVYERISISSASSATAIVNQAFSYQFAYVGPDGSVVATPTITSDGDWLTWDGTTMQLSGTPSATGTATVNFSVSFTSASGDVSDTRNMELTINIFDGVAITSDATSQTYVGADYSYSVSASVADATLTADTTAVDQWLSWTSPELSGRFTSSAVTDASPYYNEYTVKFGATAMVNGVQTTTSMDHTIRVYAALAFTTKPAFEYVSAAAASADNTKSLLISASISGATEISIDWGDGSDPLTYTPQDGSIAIVPMHNYETDGVYTVTITATNDQGDSQTKIKYDTADGSWANESDSGNDVAGFIEDNSLVIVIGIAAAICAIVAALRFPYAWILAIICIAAIIACVALDVTALSKLL